MERRIPRERRRFLKRDSDRSGFTYFRRELVNDDGWLVHPDEKDEPPPSTKPIGAEGGVNTGESRTRAEKMAYPTAKTEIYNP
jgi:hypothetical protein